MKHHQGLGLLRCIFVPFSSSESQFLAYYLHISGRKRNPPCESAGKLLFHYHSRLCAVFCSFCPPQKKKMRWPYISIHLGFSITCSWPELRIQPWIEAVKPLGLQLMPFPFLLACRTTAWQDNTEAWRYWPTLSQFHCRMCQWQRESSVLVTRYTHFWYLVFSLGYF